MCLQISNNTFPTPKVELLERQAKGVKAEQQPGNRLPARIKGPFLFLFLAIFTIVLSDGYFGYSREEWLPYAPPIDPLAHIATSSHIATLLTPAESDKLARNCQLTDGDEGARSLIVCPRDEVEQPKL